MNDYFDSDGLLNSRKDEKHAENSLLWYVEYLLLLDKSNSLTEAHISHMGGILEKCRVRPGIFAQNPEFARRMRQGDTSHDMYMSPDQMVAIFTISAKFGWEYHYEIWSEIKRQKCRYDNLKPDKPSRWIHPRDLIYYGYLAGSKWAKLLLPLYYIMLLITFSKGTGTSTRILSWVKNVQLVQFPINRFIWCICDKLIRRKFGSWAKVFSIYFPHSDHPIQVLANKLYK